MSPAITGLLPRREAQLVEHFIARCDADATAQLADMAKRGELDGLSLRAKLGVALRGRLGLLAPHVGTWPQALAVLSRPPNIRPALAALHATVDSLWGAVGDGAVDASWYTKRALLAGVYTSTELYMLTDYSPEFEDTWRALDRRLDDAVALGRWVADLESQSPVQDPGGGVQPPQATTTGADNTGRSTQGGAPAPSAQP